MWWLSVKCIFFLIFIIILINVGWILIKIVKQRKNKGLNEYKKSFGSSAHPETSNANIKFSFNRCVSNESKDSGFSGDEGSACEYIGKIREKLNRINSVDGPYVKKFISNDNFKTNKILKGPSSLPFIGSLHLLGGPGGPFEIFTSLSHKYGEIYSIKLGSSNCVVVSSYRLLKEVLVTKGNHFGGRPDFQRFHELFGGDRDNSLALCDWSDLQKTRRSIARSYCSPRNGSMQQNELGKVGRIEANRMIEFLQTKEALPILNGDEPLKPLLLATVANMFTRYMCSSWFSYSDNDFRRTVRIFDEIFWEINQGYAIDFLPWLSPFYISHMKRLRNWANDIRKFILQRIINDRRSSLDLENRVPRDFTDALLLHLESPDTNLSWDHVMFELEDFLGGHSAIGNLAMLVFAYVVRNPQVQMRIQEECDAACQRRASKFADLEDRQDMPYTEATIWETLRVSSSPIVPHVATRDTDIDGYEIRKDTVVFINNYELNLGETYWGAGARDFRPERFLAKKNDTEGYKLIRPSHFVPFSIGKRTCIGQRLVQGFTFATVTAILSRYSISATESPNDFQTRVGPGSVAVPPDTFHLILTPRSII